jgi:hypothetical protein
MIGRLPEKDYFLDYGVPFLSKLEDNAAFGLSKFG